MAPKRSTPAAKRPAKKLANPLKGFHTTPVGRTLAYSPEFADFFRKHKRDIVRVKRLIVSNLASLKKMKRGEVLIDQRSKISLFVDYTGSLPGGNRVAVLRVGIGGRELFVKIEPETVATKRIHAFGLANDFLMQQGYLVGGFKVNVIKPHVFHLISHGREQLVISATDFYHRHEVSLVHDLPKKDKEKILPVLSFLARKLAFRGITDLSEKNTFFDRKRNLLLLFDLNAE